MHNTTSTRKQSVKLTVSQPLGARDVADLARVAMRYAADITVQKHDLWANGKSCFDLLAMQAHRGDTLQIIAQGDDADQAIDALKQLLLPRPKESPDSR